MAGFMGISLSMLASLKLMDLDSFTESFQKYDIDKMALNCACVGGNSKAPLGIVSMTENLMMAIMGAILIFTSMTAPTLKQSPVSLLEPPAIEFKN
jgi:uncharacterized membrane protein